MDAVFARRGFTVLGEPQTRARKDLLLIGVIVLVVGVLVLLDPDQVIQWMMLHKQLQMDEFLTDFVVVGTGFGVYSWRRWSDLSRQVKEYKRLQGELSQLNQEAARLSETDDLLHSCFSIEEAYRVVVRHMEMQFSWLSGAIFAVDPGRDAVDKAAEWGMPALQQNHFPMRDCLALRRGRDNVSSASDPKLACTHIGAPLPMFAMCVPMIAQGEVLGILYLEADEKAMNAEKSLPEQFLNEQQKRTVKTLAEHLALTIANLTLRETLRTQSIRDPLTGLFNRRYMEESLEREFRRVLRKGVPMSVLMVDIDHFKRLNDTYGHEAGDAVLREMAKMFQAHLRAEDIASRYGGEEFLLILPETSCREALECAERLLTGCRGMRVQHYDQTLEGIRISIGMACYPQTGDSADALLRAADAALYRAKEKGRDQVHSAEGC